jgi:hypothetical protein
MKPSDDNALGRQVRLPTELKAAPLWALAYVGRMAALCQYGRPLRVVTAPDSWFDAAGRGLDGTFFNSTSGKDDLIILRESAEPTERWYDTLAHEFAHALHAEIDRYVALNWAVDAGYRELVEAFVPLLGGLVQALMEPHPEGSRNELPAGD